MMNSRLLKVSCLLGEALVTTLALHQSGESA